MFFLSMVSLMLAGAFQTPEWVGKPPLGICEVLQNLDRYKGQVVEVRGEWFESVLKGDGCPALKTNGYTWANAITLELPENLAADEPPSQRPYWTLNRDEWLRADSTHARLSASKGANNKVVARFVGRLDVRLETFGKAEGFADTTPYGYGHLNQCPARLVIIAVREVALSETTERR